MLDLFSGIGGFSYAAQQVWGDDMEIVSFVEIDPFCQKVLRKHWPDVPIVEDIKDVTEEIITDSQSNRLERRRMEKAQQASVPSGYCETSINLLTGGFPCQPASVAGKRQGKADDRWLWPEMFRVIRTFKPTWVIAENVYGLLTLDGGMVFEHCCADLEGEGYEVQPFIIPACAVNAPHRRDRVWIVAYFIGNAERPTYGQRKREVSDKEQNNGNEVRNDVRDIRQDVADTDNSSRSRRRQDTGMGLLKENEGKTGKTDWERTTQWAVEPDVGRVAHGVPNRVHRLKALGNAIVPQVAMVLMLAIKEITDDR
jgi:DNA (cytosine-5)-methyltransferase 1